MNDITSQIGTKHQQTQLVLQIDTLLKSLFTKDASFNDSLNKTIPDKTKQMLLSYMEKTNVQTEVVENVRVVLEQLKQTVLKLPVLKLHIAFHPSAKGIEILSEWVKANVGNEAIIDFIYEPKLLGGAVVEYQGRLKDYSMNKKIDEYFKRDFP